MKKILLISISYFLLVFGIGCSDPLPSDLGFEYFPYANSQYRIYQHEVKHYLIDGSIVEEEYQIKEVVTEEEIKGNEITFKLERFRRDDEGDSWVTDSVWSARKNNYNVVVVEHNIPIIKLSFPVEEARRWDGNAMNANDYDEFKMVGVDKMYTLDSNVYPETVILVKEELIDTIVKTDYRIEVFAKGIGLVYKEDRVLEYDFNNPGTIVEGIEFSQKLIESGEEI